MIEFARDNILLIAVAVISGVMLVLPALRRGGGGHSVDTLQATQRINREDAMVIDVRDAAEVAQGKILGARAVPLAQRPKAVAASGGLHHPARAKHVIFLFMNGGVSQVDTFDPKPELDKYHGQPIPTKKVHRLR